MKTRIKLVLLTILVSVFTTIKMVSGQNQIVSISVDSLNVLYAGIDNPVTIAVSGVATDKISVSISSGFIKGSNGKYTVYVTKLGMDTIKVAANGKMICEKVFHIKQIPYPVAYLGDFTNGSEITKEQLSKIQKVDVKIPNFPYDYKIEVLSFSMKKVVKEKNLPSGKSTNNEVYNATSAFLTDEMKDNSKINEGPNIYIENIKVKLPDGTIKTISPLIIILAN